MTILYIGLALFFLPHVYSMIRSRAAGRDIKARMGEGPYMGLYSLVSAAGLGLMIWGYMSAPPGPQLVQGVSWGRTASLYLMLPAFILLAAAYVPNTYIKKTIHHPMLSAVILWAIAHMLRGADLKELLLFGGFLAYGILDFIAVSRRGEDFTKMQPSPMNDLIAIAIGGGVYAATVFWAHEALFGIRPLV